MKIHKLIIVLTVVFIGLFSQTAQAMNSEAEAKFKTIMDMSLDQLGQTSADVLGLLVTLLHHHEVQGMPAPLVVLVGVNRGSQWYHGTEPMSIRLVAGACVQPCHETYFLKDSLCRINSVS